MSPEERLRVDHLVLAAAALDSDDQGAFLERLPEVPDTVRSEVRRRLRAAGSLPEGFLLAPATELLEAACAEPEEPAPPPPEGDERYEIGECLGVGGMARVYRAFDRQLDRPVALKILQATDPAPAHRLLREARAQARVRHDHVLDVYETGELGGRPYIAVRLVTGGTLADWIDERSASLEQKVALVAQAAEGLHAAHREGLLHGDVKPSNVLVEQSADGELKAWIGDFGIATEIETGRADPGGLAGTPQFMAPELLRGDPASADRRSDVYSLGVTLFQVLTGTLPPGNGSSPFPASSPAVPTVPAVSLPADLRAIVERCLAEDPGDRYPSARAVGEDLRRFLDGDVVEAYADRLAYRLTRFAVRHRALFAVGGVSALLLAAALVVAAVLGVQAVRANSLAEKRRVQAEELITFTLLDLRDKLEPVGRLDLLDNVGERAMAYFAAVPETELSDEELSRRSVALYQIGDVRMRQGDLAGAEGPLEESLALARQLAERAPDDTDRLFALGQSEFWAGYARWERGDLPAAKRHFEAYHDISEHLVAIDPEALDWQLELSYAHSNLGSVLQAQGDLPGALAQFRKTLEIDRRLVAVAPDPERAEDWRFELAATHNTIGVVLERMGRLAEASEQYAADLEMRQELTAADPENQRWLEFLGTSHQYLGALALARGELADARPHLERSRELFDGLVARDPDNGDWRYKLAWSELRLGRLERAAGQPERAREAWQSAEALADELAATDPEHIDWRLLLGVARLHAALLPGPPPSPSEQDRLGPLDPLERALEVLGPLAAEHPHDRRAHRWLAEGLLTLGDRARWTGDEAGARSAWSRAAEALAPFVAAGSAGANDHELLEPWLRALDRLGRGDEAAAVRAGLGAMGIAGEPPPEPPPESVSAPGLAGGR